MYRRVHIDEALVEPVALLEMRYARRLGYAKAHTLRVVFNLIVARARNVKVRVVEAADVAGWVRRNLLQRHINLLLVVHEIIT